MSKVKIEIPVYSIDGALKAQEGGADRIELCDNPGEGGTTPSFGAIEVVRQNISMDVFVMIRPRGGDFLYSNYEYRAMSRDIMQCQRISVDGIVLGILNADGTLDKKRCKELIDRARPLQVTCHRAFDMTRDAEEALEDCIEVGFSRVLTSGFKSTAEEGLELITRLVNQAGDRIIIVPGSGIREHNIEKIAGNSRAREYHFSATKRVTGKMAYRNNAIVSMGTSADDEYEMRTVDSEAIGRMRILAENAI